MRIETVDEPVVSAWKLKRKATPGPVFSVAGWPIEGFLLLLEPSTRLNSVFQALVDEFGMEIMLTVLLLVLDLSSGTSLLTRVFRTLQLSSMGSKTSAASPLETSIPSCSLSSSVTS